MRVVLKPVEMVKLRVYGLQSKIDDVLEALQNLGVIHIKELEDNVQAGELAKINEYYLKLEGLRKRLGLSYVKHLYSLEEALLFMDDLKDEFAELELILDSETVYDKELKYSKQRLMDYEAVLSFVKKKPKILGFKVYRVLSPLGEDINRTLSKLSREKRGCLFKLVKFKKSAYIFVFFKKTEDPTPELGKLGLSLEEIPIPSVGLDEEIKKLREEVESKELYLKELRKKKERLVKRLQHYIGALAFTFMVIRDRVLVKGKIKKWKKFFLLEGWVPKDKLKITERELKRLGVDYQIVEDHDTPPTLLRNPDPVKPFEFVTKMLSLPKGNEIDPSGVYFITLSFLYGMVIGDVVYSLISILIAHYLEKKVNDVMVNNVAKIWKVSAFFGILWGVFFDEWMGASHYYWLKTFDAFGLVDAPSHPIYEGFHRVHKLVELIVLTVVVGILHLLFGFLFGFVNEWKHNKKHALGKLFWASLMASTFLLAVSELGPLGISFHVSYEILGGIAILCLLGIALTEGFVGIMELATVTSNMLSYSRIAAVGVVGVVIAEVINMFFTPTPFRGIGNLIAFPMLIVLHFINAFIAMFEGTVQAGRLNLYEFSSKFFHGGGKLYKPFKVDVKEVE